MSRRRVLVVLPLLALGAVLLAVWLLRTPVTRANFDRLEVGMTLDAVEALLGPSHGAWASKGRVEGPATYVTNPDRAVQEREGYKDYRRHLWYSSELTVVGVFEDETLVCRFAGDPVVEPLHVRLWLFVNGFLP